MSSIKSKGIGLGALLSGSGRQTDRRSSSRAESSAEQKNSGRISSGLAKQATYVHNIENGKSGDSKPLGDNSDIPNLDLYASEMSRAQADRGMAAFDFAIQDPEQNNLRL